MIFTVTASRDFEGSPEAVFAAWLDPARRARFETPEGSGMRLAVLDTREGGHEEVAVGPEGAETGRMPTDIRVLRPPADGAPGLLVVHGTGVFGGAVAMTMQTAVTVAPRGTGARLTGTSQIVAPGGQPTEAQVREGWEAMLDRFAADLSEHPA